MAARDLALDAHALTSRVGGPVALPGDATYDRERAGFDLSADQRPAVVVGATSTTDVVAAVRFAREHALPVGVLATGHGPTAPADGSLLINTGRANSVQIDPAGRTAWLQAGATWAAVIEAAAENGLAPLCGSSPAIGAVGYTIGGGVGPLGRAFGFAADHVRGIGLVTADAERRQIAADRDPDLFWAVRGGGGNFGVVTDLEVALFPVARLYGGSLYFPGTAAEAVLTAFVECAENAPDELSLSVAIINFPDLPDLPPQLRGQFRVHARVACAGPSSVAEQGIGPLRAAGPVVLDTVQTMPFTAVGTIHSDPTAPQPENVRSLVLREFDAAAITALLPYLEPTTPFMTELRHLGGALARPPATPNPVGHRGGAMNLLTSAYPDPGGRAADELQRQLLDELAPWSDGGPLYTFLAGAQVTLADVRAAFADNDFARLRAVKASWDPDNMFRVNANIPPLPTAPA